MNRSFVLSLFVVLGGTAALLSTTAQSQISPGKAYVALQPSLSTSQSGNLSISGKGLFGSGVGIGTASPGRAFHASSGGFASSLFESSHASGSAIELFSAASSTAWEYAVTGTNGIFGLPNGSAYLRRQGNLEPAFAMLPTNNVQFTGFVGIGLANPQRALHVLNGSLYAARFETSTNGATVVELRNSAADATWEYTVTGTTGVFGLPAGSAYFHKQGNGFPAIVMTPSNLVGIGTASPTQALTVVTPGGSGVYGTFSNNIGTVGAGLYGRGPSGVVGQATQASGFGLISYGDMAVFGSKSFQIDHPHDPENRFLRHYCAEGPEPQNVYNGCVETDGDGYAEVRLPDYYEDINKDARIQLTVVNTENPNQFAQAMVVQKVRDGKFVIRTSAPRVEVFWEVKARRNDLWVRKHGAPVEPEKREHEVGKYQVPELYGLPPERGIYYQPEGGAAGVTRK